MNAGELRDIIEKIEKVENLTRTEITTKVVVDRTYISDLVNNHQEKEITDNLFRKFKTAFPAYFPKTNKPNKNIPKGANGKHTPQNDLLTISRDFTETGIRHEAAINVMVMTLAEMLAGKSGKSTAYEHSELLRTISSESDRLRGERRRVG